MITFCERCCRDMPIAETRTVELDDGLGLDFTVFCLDTAACDAANAAHWAAADAARPAYLREPLPDDVPF